MEESYAAQQLQLQRAQDIINQHGPSLSIQELLSKNISFIRKLTASLTCRMISLPKIKPTSNKYLFLAFPEPQIRALQAIVREYQGSPSTYDQESARVIEKTLQATEAQLSKTEVRFGAIAHV